MAEFTEEETEYWLAEETRQLPMPDGSELSFTDTRVLWNAYDFLQAHGGLTARRIVTLALAEREKRGLPFDITFPHVVSRRYEIARDEAEARIRVIDEALLTARLSFERSFRRAAAQA